MVKISVIICTYNPQPAIFSRCLECVEAASAIYRPHEVLLIDNNSTPQLDEFEYISSFLRKNENARLIRETRQGLTPARLTGIRESSGELLIFVDDDNLIDPDYFSVAANILTSHPFIGAFSGQVSLEYEQPPEAWTKKYWGMLIYRELSKDTWSNQPFNNESMPNGAGMCVTRDTAAHYVTLFDSGKRNFTLDRSKQSLLSAGDNDLAMCACDIGKGMGLFKALHLKHCIPPSRFSLEYLSKLAYGIYYSHVLLFFMREGRIEEKSTLYKLKMLVRIGMMKRKDRIIQRAAQKGTKDAVSFLRSNTLKQ